MVRTQFACGTGRRCALEIEITGTFEQVEPAMQRGQEGRRLPVEQREWIIVEVEMQEVELLVVAFLADALQHHHMQRIRIAYRAVEAQCFWPSGVKFGR